MITMTHPTHSTVTYNEIFVRALNSITPKQGGVIAGIVQASGLIWDVQTVDDYNGYRSILIEATIGSDKQNAFYIAGTVQRLELFDAQDDRMALIGTFTDVEALGVRLTGLVGPQ